MVLLFAVHPPSADALDPCKGANIHSSASAQVWCSRVVSIVSHAPSLDPCKGIDDCRTDPKLVTDASSVLRALPIFIFSYTCHQNIVSISNELDNPTSVRVLKVIASAIGLTVSVYIVLAYAGYSTFGAQVPLLE